MSDSEYVLLLPPGNACQVGHDCYTRVGHVLAVRIDGVDCEATYKVEWREWGVRREEWLTSDEVCPIDEDQAREWSRDSWRKTMVELKRQRERRK